MSVETAEELWGLTRAGRAVANTLRAMGARVRPGITTGELDAYGERLLGEAGAEPAPRSTYGFPGATCISVNDEVAHGIPGDRILEEGDLVNIDVSARLDGFVADTGASFPVGTIDPLALALCRAGRAALEAGIGAVRTGRPFSGLGLAIERSVRSAVVASDGWTLRTADGSRVVQFEHTVVTTRNGALVLTLPDRRGTPPPPPLRAPPSPPGCRRSSW